MKLFKNINFDRLKSGLSKTRSSIVNSISEVISGKAIIDDSLLDQIEEILISADLGADTSGKVIENVRVKLREIRNRSAETIYQLIKDELISILKLNYKNETITNKSINKPYVNLIVGVNGAGKTTTIGKLANYYKADGKTVIIGSADTFRAAANEQLKIWTDRVGVEIFRKEHGADPSSVAFETVKHAIDTGSDVVLIDTAGRLQNKTNLMNELNKINRAIDKILPGAPHETFLVLDGTVGQNAISQAQEFAKILTITGLIITKLDGTAKGGAVVQVCLALKIPIKFICTGESIDDLILFNPEAFVESLFQDSTE